MSRISLKLFIAGLGIILAITSTASAQLSQMRLFSPYPDDEFGGGAYTAEGLYGSIGAGWMMITSPGGQPVGDKSGSQMAVGTTMDGSTMGTAYSSSIATAYPTASQINTGNMRPGFVSATEFELGNYRGHHGWSVKGTVVSPLVMTQSGYDAGVTIYDPPFIDVQTIYGNNPGFYVWTGTPTEPIKLLEYGTVQQIGRLWGIVGLFGSGTSGINNSGGGSGGGTNPANRPNKYAFVPIPITYDTWAVRSAVNTWSVEAMYNYRFHPFRRGILELMLGARYTCFDETFNFFGHSTTKLTADYTNTRIEILKSTSVVGSENPVTVESENFAQNTQQEAYVVGADLGYSNWNFEAQNHLVGPQLGLRYTLANGRWRFTTDNKFFAAANRQNLYTDGDLGLKPSSTQSTNVTATNGLPLYAPIGTVQNHIGYNAHFTEFSPSGDFKVEAAWHWTHAVSFKFGYQLLYMGNIARGTTYNYYAMNEDGTIFRPKDKASDRNADTIVHGAMFGVQINK